MKRIAGPLLLVLALACGMPTMLDLDGRPIAHPAQVALFEGGWLVLDSARGAVRAIVELAMDQWDVGPMESAIPRLGLRLPDGDQRSPNRVAFGPSYCPAANTGPAQRNGPGYSPQNPWTTVPEPCVRLARAEFSLASLPRPTDTTTLVWGNRALSLRWHSGASEPHVVRR